MSTILNNFVTVLCPARVPPVFPGCLTPMPRALGSGLYPSLSLPIWMLQPYPHIQFSSFQLLSHVHLFATPWSAACHLLVHHQLLQFTQTHVRWASDANQPSHPLSSPSPPTFSLSQHQVLEVSNVLEFQLQHQSFPMNIQDWFPLGWTGLILLSKGLSRVFSNTTVQKHQFFSTQLSL